MEHYFCQACGCALQPSFKFDHYSRKTGDRLYIQLHTCPNFKWWNVWHDQFILHDSSFGTTPVYFTENYVRSIGVKKTNA